MSEGLGFRQLVSVCLPDRRMSVVCLFRARGQQRALKQPQGSPEAAACHSPSSATPSTSSLSEKHSFRPKIDLSPNSSSTRILTMLCVNRFEPAQIDVWKFCRRVEIGLESFSALPRARATSPTPDWRVGAEAPPLPRARMCKYYKKLRTLTHALWWCSTSGRD